MEQSYMDSWRGMNASPLGWKQILLDHGTFIYGLQERNGILNYKMEAGSGRQWNIHLIMDSWRGMEDNTTRWKQVLLDYGNFSFG
jgi:hypothetical protein